MNNAREDAFMNKSLGGWWRLWIFLSVLWGIAVSTGFVINWPNSTKGYEFTDSDKRLLSNDTQRLIAVDKYAPFASPVSLENVAPEEIDAIINKIGIKPIDIINLADGSLAPASPMAKKPKMIYKFCEKFYDYTDLMAHIEIDYTLCRSDYETIENKIVHKHQFIYSLKFFILWIFPCVAILSLWLGIKWVILGFKKQSTGPNPRT
jgi:hypothetical protein